MVGFHFQFFVLLFTRIVLFTQQLHFHFLLQIPVSFSFLSSNFSSFSAFDFLFVFAFCFQLQFHFQFLFVDSFLFLCCNQFPVVVFRFYCWVVFRSRFVFRLLFPVLFWLVGFHFIFVVVCFCSVCIFVFVFVSAVNGRLNLQCCFLLRIKHNSL